MWWKQYYVLRNELINERRYKPIGGSIVSLFFRRFLPNCGASLVFPDARLRRLWYSCRAFGDAVLNRVHVNRFVTGERPASRR